MANEIAKRQPAGAVAQIVPGRREKITFRNAQIMWRNFAGEERKYNDAGKRNFHVLLDNDTAQELLAAGVPVKFRPVREEGDIPQAHLLVHVGFKAQTKPKVVLVGSKSKTTLTEPDLVFADWAEIEDVNLIVNVVDWEMNGNSGRKVWLDAIYINVLENEFDQMYAQLPEQQMYDALEASIPEDLGELRPITDNGGPVF